jgi:hypothetical protein
METADRALLDQWMANWKDIVDFEVHSSDDIEGSGRTSRTATVT